MGERRTPATPMGYRNGFGKTRQHALSNGTITLRRPRARDLDERFVSRVLPLFKRRSEEVGALLPELYLHGVALGDLELALRGLLGDGAPLSASSILHLKAVWQAQYAAWKQLRSLAAGASLPLGGWPLRESRSRGHEDRAPGGDRWAR